MTTETTFPPAGSEDWSMDEWADYYDALDDEEVLDSDDNSPPDMSGGLLLNSPPDFHTYVGETSICPYCFGEMTWCGGCQMYTMLCCEEYGSCMCS